MKASWLRESLQSARDEVATWPEWKKAAMRVLPEPSRETRRLVLKEQIRVLTEQLRAAPSWAPVTAGACECTCDTCKPVAELRAKLYRLHCELDRCL